VGQIWDLVKLFGIGKLARMGISEKISRRYIRGYCATTCFSAILDCGLADRMVEARWVHVDKFAEDNALDKHVLEAILDYLDGISVVRLDEGFCRLTRHGKILMGMPRGAFSLLYGYAPVFHRLQELLRRQVEYGRDVTRRGEYIAKGSGELARHLPFPIMILLIRARGLRNVLDLGSGDLEFLFALCKEDSNIRCHGIDISPDAVRYANTRLQESDYAGRVTTAVGDMFDIRQTARELPDIDTITAVDTFHEYLTRGHEVVVNLLRDIREAYPKAYLVVGEFCKQTRESLRRRPTGFLEHHLFHSLSDQEILFAGDWEKIFDQAGYFLEEKKIFSIVGHGYFVLRSPDAIAG